MQAEIYEGAKETLKYLLKNNIKIRIISHKTQYPYIGKKLIFDYPQKMVKKIVK